MNTLEQLQKEARERFESLFTKNGELSPSVSIVTLQDNNDALIAKAFLAGEKKENKAWLEGSRCFNCGDVRENHPTSGICDKCWEEE